MRNRQNYFSLLLFLLVFITAIDVSRCDMNLTLSNGYNKYEPPKNASGGPFIVRFGLMNKIRIGEVNTDHLTLQLHMVVFSKWSDDRLKTFGQLENTEVSR